eukprot:1776171-Pleurochrysis_carterae.AAC.1
MFSFLRRLRRSWLVLLLVFSCSRRLLSLRCLSSVDWPALSYLWLLQHSCSWKWPQAAYLLVYQPRVSQQPVESGNSTSFNASVEAAGKPTPAACPSPHPDLSSFSQLTPGPQGPEFASQLPPPILRRGHPELRSLPARTSPSFSLPRRAWWYAECDSKRRATNIQLLTRSRAGPHHS